MICHFSPDRRYRYTLLRMLPPSFGFWRPFSGSTVQFIGLNPSTADEKRDDPTIRRLMSFARAWGFTTMWMTNLFAYRATDPMIVLKEPDPIGPENDKYLREIALKADLVVACWGVHGWYLNRGDVVRTMIPNLHAFAINGDGTPAHPLYLRGSTIPEPWPLPKKL